MPVAQSQGHAGKVLAVSAVGVAIALLLAFLVAQAASRGDVEIRLGDDRFEVGSADTFAERIAEGEGLPLLFQDLVQGGRNLFVSHVGDDPEAGWVAFGAFDPDDPSCAVEIDRDAGTLVSACDAAVSYPLDGQGLRQYPVEVEGGKVFVDLNETSTTTAP
jgi:hypothetical protein